MQSIDKDGKSVLLMLMPFWTPLIPPMGITCLKNYLNCCGHRVKTVDFNVDDQIRNRYRRYFDVLSEIVPVDRRGNFFSIGQDVLRNHMLAYINRREDSDSTYRLFVHNLLYKTFFCHIEGDEVEPLNQVVLDIFSRLEELMLPVLAEKNPEVVGISVFKGTIAASLFGFRLVKKHHPHVLTVMGGGTFADQLAPGSANLEFFLEKTLDSIDKIIIGEGELLFKKLLDDEFPGSQRVFTLADTGGQIVDISTLKTVDLSDIQLRYYPYLPAFISRGCPFRCSFCSETVLWGKYRHRNIKEAAREMLHMSRFYGSQLFLLTDSLLNPVIDDFSRAIVASGCSIYWDGYLRVSPISGNTEKTVQWRQGGFYRARIGVESGAQRILEVMNKKITPQEIKQTLSALSYAGIKTSTLWIVGHPGETDEDFAQTLELIEQCKDLLYDAEGTPFWYYETGQANSLHWNRMRKPLFPGFPEDLLIVQEWVWDGEPSREKTYDRLNRFVQHCDKLRIPNPYSLKDIYEADKRWQQLHKNAVPPLADF